ncbi:MAG: recombinase RecA [Polyangia bacterium]|jgi:recombination protein RecA|nr:recombinase RecA [Polyangia bacterium]
MATRTSHQERRSIGELLKTLEKHFGSGCIMRLGDAPVANVPAIPSGSLGLDLALGVGGYPRGRLVEIYGPESSGKTTLALTAIAQAQRQGGICAFVDAEHALDVQYAQALGVNLADILVSQPDYGEQALAIVDRLCQSQAVDLIVVDSVAALVPKAELDGEVGDMHVGLQARLMSQAMRKLAAVASKLNTTVIFINQLRHKIGVKFGSPETTPGGNALKFYASVRLDIRRIGGIKQGEENVGNRVRVKVVKNKLAPPFRQAEFEVRFGQGVDSLGEILDLATEHGVVRKSGAYYSLGAGLGGERIGQGRERALEHLRGEPALATLLETELRALIQQGSAHGAPGQPSAGVARTTSATCAEFCDERAAEGQEGEDAPGESEAGSGQRAAV